MEEKQVDFERSLEHSAEGMDDLRSCHVAADSRISELENTIRLIDTQLKEQIDENVRLQRYTRSFNLRFGGIKEETNEDCMKVLTELFESKLGIQEAASMMENAHRSRAFQKRNGKSGPPCHIIVRSR